MLAKSNVLVESLSKSMPKTDGTQSCAVIAPVIITSTKYNHKSRSHTLLSINKIPILNAAITEIIQPKIGNH